MPLQIVAEADDTRDPAPAVSGRPAMPIELQARQKQPPQPTHAIWTHLKALEAEADTRDPAPAVSGRPAMPIELGITSSAPAMPIELQARQEQPPQPTHAIWTHLKAGEAACPCFRRFCSSTTIAEDGR